MVHKKSGWHCQLDCCRKEVNMNYYNEIKNKLIDNEVYTIVKDYSKDRHKVITYFEIGKLLNEAE